MASEKLKIHPENPEINKISKAADAIKKGGVILYPSDTGYALACNLSDKSAIEKIRSLKGIKKDQSLTFICKSLDNISEFAKVKNEAFKTMKALIPGPYTFILPASNLVPKLAQNPKRKTAGIRVPNSNITQSLIDELENPMISISASKEDLFNDEMLIDHYFKQVDLVLYLEEPEFTGESTIIDMTDNNFQVVREGAGMEYLKDFIAE